MPNNKKKLSPEARRAMWRYIWTFQWSWNYERMQALGFAWSIFPVLEKVKKSKDELIAAMQRHLGFFNTHPPMGAAIFGAAVALEEEGADPDVIDSLKVGLMGPFAGIGDTLFAILTRPIIGTFAAALALQGNMFGFWLMVAFGLFWALLFQYLLFHVGYRQGINVVSEVSEAGLLGRITEMATIMGVTVIGGFIPSILRVQTALKFTQEVEIDGQIQQKVVMVQDTLDQILPYAVPIGLVAFTYWLIKGRQWKPIQALGALVVIGFVGSLIGIF